MSYIFIGATVVCIILVFGFHIYSNLRQIENNWSEYRCNPLFMPLAWMFSSKKEADENFSKCMASYGSALVADSKDIFGSQFALIEEILESISNPLSIFRKLMSSIRGMMLSFTNKTLGKLNGPVSAFAYVLNKIQDLFRRMAGEGYIATFLGVSVVSFMESFLTLFISIIKGFIFAMMAISFMLALFQPELLVIVLFILSLLAGA
jgi:hypothetical protein